MAYTLKQKLANKANYGEARNTSKIKYICIHYTGNDGDTDDSNANYFQKNIVKASAHYFVDSDSVTQAVPDNYVAWAVGGQKWADCGQTGGGRLYGKCTNSNSLSIELCDDKRNGVVYPSAATIANAIELTKKLMKQYNIPAENVVRHFDVNGKTCPAYWCGTVDKNAKWKSEFWNKLQQKEGDSMSDNELEIKKLPIIVDGNQYTIDGVFVGGLNFVSVRQLASLLGCTVSSKGSTPVLTKK